MKYRLILFCYLLASSGPLWAYGTLSEFVNSAQTTYRDVIAGDGIETTDIIKAPKWKTSSFPLQLEICTGTDPNELNHATYFPVFLYKTTGLTKQAQIIADITAVQTTWSFGTGSAVSFNTPTTVDCPAFTDSGFDTFNAAHRLIVFSYYYDTDTASYENSLPPGVLAYTPTTLDVESGELVITDGDIVFNSDEFFATGDCDAVLTGASAGACQNSGYAAYATTFKGVLTHEMGHLLGISHSMINDDNSSDSTNTQATMYPAIQTIAESRAVESLELDDQLARENLYPSTGFPSSSTGSISGYVMRDASLGQRGAHVAIFDLTAKKTIAGVFTSMTGSRSDPSGYYQIQGLPLNTALAIFVEPVERSADGLATSSSNFNTPVAAALQNETDGFKTFEIEAYPDVSFPDVRLDRTASTAALADAESITLTSSNRTLSNMNFYLNQDTAAPNDAADAAISLNEDIKITSDNPVMITLTASNGLGIFSNPTFSLSAALKDGKSYDDAEDWSNLVPTITYQGTEATVTIDNSTLKRDGTYLLHASLTDSKYGTIETSKDLKFGGGGGGCQIGLRPTPFSKISWGLALTMILFILGLSRMRRSFVIRELKSASLEKL